MSAGLRGVSATSDASYANKEAKLMKTMKFPKEYTLKPDLTRVNWEVMKVWIAQRVTELLGVEDDVLIGYVYEQLEGHKTVDPRKLQIALTGFLEKNTSLFCKELWVMLDSAAGNESGIPQAILDAKAEEVRRRKEVQDAISAKLASKEENREETAMKQLEEQQQQAAAKAKLAAEQKKREEDAKKELEEQQRRRRAEREAEEKARRERPRDSDRDRRRRDDERRHDRRRSRSPDMERERRRRRERRSRTRSTSPSGRKDREGSLPPPPASGALPGFTSAKDTAPVGAPIENASDGDEKDRKAREKREKKEKKRLKKEKKQAKKEAKKETKDRDRRSGSPSSGSGSDGDAAEKDAKRRRLEEDLRQQALESVAGKAD